MKIFATSLRLASGPLKAYDHYYISQFDGKSIKPMQEIFKLKSDSASCVITIVLQSKNLNQLSNPSRHRPLEHAREVL